MSNRKTRREPKSISQTHGQDREIHSRQTGLAAASSTAERANAGATTVRTLTLYTVTSAQMHSYTRSNWLTALFILAQTIDKLYIGQRLHPEALHFDTNPPPPPPQVIAQAPQQKTSLHSFWNIRSTPASTQDITFSAVDQKETGLRCQGCDREVSQYSAGASETLDLDMDMNMNGVEEDALACRGCGKRVCDACAVQRCARVCLECATDGFG